MDPAPRTPERRTALGTCHLCDACCGVRVEVEGAGADERVVAVKGDPDDVFSAGHVCPKVTGLQHVHHDPDRVRAPLKRQPDGSFRPVAWDVALDEAGAQLARLQRAHGNDAVALYVGNPVAHVYGAVFAVGALLGVLQTKNAYSANSLDSLPRQLASQILYGSRLLLPVPDLDRARLLVVLGANPAVSNGSMMTAPGVKKRLTALKERGGKIIVLDPRQTETAALADRHLFVRPGSDVFLLASLLHVVFRDRGARAAAWVDGVAALQQAVAPFSPAATAGVTGVAVDDVVALAHEFADAEAAVVHARVGTSTQRHGTLTSWLVDALHLVTGHIDRPGTLMFPTPAADLDGLARGLGLLGHFDRWRSRVRGLPEFNGELPTAALAEEIETPGPGQVKGLITVAGNPCSSAPNAGRLDAAVAGLDVVVAVDLYVNETTRHAHYIFPPTFGLENDHYPLLFAGVAVRNVAHFTAAALTTTTTTTTMGPRPEPAILGALAASIVRHRRPVVGAALSWALRAALALATPRRVLDVLLRLGPHRLSLRTLRQHPHGLDLGPLQPRLPAALSTSTRRVDLAPRRFVDPLRALAATVPPAAPAGEDGEDGGDLVVIGRRALRSNNSWMHNVAPLLRGQTCTLLIHPDDAAARAIVDGAAVVVTSRTGALTVTAEVSSSVMPGVVCLPHGWGHAVAGAQLRVAQQSPGVNVNLITDDEALDGLSGAAAYNGVAVSVRAA